MALANLTNIFTFYVRSPFSPFYLFLDLFLRQFAVVRTNVKSHLSVVFYLTVPLELRAHSRALSPQPPVGLYLPHFRSKNTLTELLNKHIIVFMFTSCS
jgi:hypothetical protein